MKGMISILLVLWLAVCGGDAAYCEAFGIRPLDESAGQFLFVPLGSACGSVKDRETVTLSAAPFTVGNVSDGSAVVYFPLFDVADIFGFTVMDLSSGRYRVVSSRLSGSSLTIRDLTLSVGSVQIRDNQTDKVLTVADVMGRTAEPVVQDGILFVPDFYLELLPSVISAGIMTPSQMAYVYSYNDGRMLAGFRLEDDYFQLSPEQTQDMEVIKTEVVVEPDENGDYGLTETWYSNGDVALGVRTGCYTYEQASTIHCITLLTDRYQTPRGLRVGDPVEMCLSLYGNLPNDSGQIEAGVLKLTQENGIITSITLRAGT